MSEFHIERGYREVYISDGDSRTSPRSQSPAGGQSNTRGPASAGVPQYKMGPPTYRSGVYLERDNTRPPRPATTFMRSSDPAYQGSHRAQVTYVVQDSMSNRESPPPPAYSPPRRLSPGRGYPTTELMRGGTPSRMYAAVHKTESAAIPVDQEGMYQQMNQRSASPYQERGDIETLVPMYTASYPSSDRSLGERLPGGSPSKIVYTTHTSPQGQVKYDPQPTSPAQSQGPPYRPSPNSPVQGQQQKPGPRGDHTGASPRPYQLKPVLDSYNETPASPIKAPPSGKEAEVDALTNLLIQNMEVSGDPDFFGQCHSCGRSIMGESNACQAMEHLYHTSCFLCSTCGLCLKGHQFFAMEGKPYCEPCYMNTLEKCTVCSCPITDRILRATGKPYHPECFTCVVCGKNLDGVPFTVDATNQMHCIDDFYKKFAPRCCVCEGPITPETGEEETVRIVAMDRSFHVRCYKCEDCGLQLSSESDGRGCYPLDEHILCKQCNAKRIQAMTTRMMTEL